MTECKIDFITRLNTSTDIDVVTPDLNKPYNMSERL